MPYITSENRPRKDVNYRHAERCAECAYFHPRGEPNNCEKVEGSISPAGVCDLWEMNKKATYDQDFFQQEAEA